MPHTRTLLLSTHQWILYGCALALSVAGVMFTYASTVSAAGLNWSADTPITVGSYNLVIRSGSKATTMLVGDTTLTVTVDSGDFFTLVSTDRFGFATIPSIQGSCTNSENAITFSNTAIITPQGTVCLPNAGAVAVAAPVASATPTPAPTPTPTTETPAKTPETKPADAQKQATQTAPIEAAKPAVEAPKPVPAPSAAAVAAEAVAVQIAEIKVESAAIAEVPKAAKVGAEEKDVLSEAKDAGLKLTTVSKGRAVDIPVAQKLVIVNFLTKDTESTKELDFDQRVDLLKQAAYFNDGKLPKTKNDVTEVLKLANNIPLTDKEISKNALNAIKRNENTFCPKKTCKGFAQFDAILRGGEAGELTEAAQKKGEKLFKEKVGRKPNLENPLHEDLVEAFALADLSKVKPAPKSKAAPAEQVKPVVEAPKLAPAPSAATVAAEAQAQAVAIQIAEIKVESAAIAEVPKTAKIGSEEKDVLSEAKDAGLTFTTISKGRTVDIPVAQKLVIVNFLTKDTESTKELDFDQRVDLLKQAAYFNDGKLSKTKNDVTELLKLANNIPLTDKEISKNTLNAIKRNEKVFCPQKTCKGFAQFDAILRGGEAGELTEATQKKGETLFKKNVGRKPNLENPLHQNLVEAFALTDLSKVKPAPKSKAAPAKSAAKSVKKK